MKRLFSVMVIFCMTITFAISSTGQVRRSPAAGTKIDGSQVLPIQTVESISEGVGALIRWQVNADGSRVGFNVYRSSGVVRTQLNSILIAGSQWRTSTDYGEMYNYFDPTGTIGSIYQIEMVDANGGSALSGDLITSYRSGSNALAGNIISLSDERVAKRNFPRNLSTLNLPKELAEEVRTSQIAPDPVTQKIIAATGGVKIGVRSDGIYRVTWAALASSGFDTNSDTSKWKLYTDGIEHAIRMNAGGQYFEFYGNGYESPESDQRYYYLIIGDSDGKRMFQRSARVIGSTVVSPSYEQTFNAKQRVFYENKILNGESENYWGNVFGATSYSYFFPLTGVDNNGGNSLVEVKVHGWSTNAHNVTLRLNGIQIGTFAWNGAAPFATTISVPLSSLVNGQNELQMNSGASNDFVMFDSIKVKYSRNFEASGGQIGFYTNNYRGARVTGFSSGSVRMFDTTFAAEPVELVNLNIAQTASGFDINLPANRGRQMFALEDAGVKSVASIAKNNPSTLSNEFHNANLVIISYGSFMQQAQAWAQYRIGQGFQVETVDVADIYDEFSYGQPTANSIKSFLSYAVNTWNTSPTYVLLIGDASFDPKNYEGQGNQNILPVKLVDTVYGEAGSDEALADFDGDGLAELSVGRIPAATGNVVSSALADVQNFEQPSMQSLNRGAIFAFDDPIGYDFEGMSVSLRNQLPPEMPAVMIGRSSPNASVNLVNEINNGRYIVNYSGHGAANQWASVNFFSQNQVPLLTNANSRSIFTMLTCLNGAFINPYFDSLSERLLKAQNGGAVAAWASSGLTTPNIQLIMGNRFYSQVAAGTIPRMGDLIRDAKTVIPGGRDVRLSWVLIGDPMLKIR